MASYSLLVSLTHIPAPTSWGRNVFAPIIPKRRRPVESTLLYRFCILVLLWIAAVANLLVFTSVQLLDLTMRGVIPHPGGHGPPPAAVIPEVLGGVLILIGGVMVGITTIRAHVFAAALGWVILISSVLLLPLAFLAGNPNVFLSTILTNTDFVLFYAGLGGCGPQLPSDGCSRAIHRARGGAKPAVIS